MKKLLKVLAGLLIGVTALAFASCGGSISIPQTHEYSETITKQATCIEKGEKTFICSCGDSYTEDIDELGHDIKEIEAKAPTCTEFGWNAYEECQRENCYYTTYKEVKAAGHSYDKGVCGTCGGQQPAEEHVHEWDEGVVTTQPTCTERGVKTFTCWCKDTYTKSVEPLKHDIEQHAGKEATCTEKGYEAYEMCKREGCGYTTYKEIAINANNHDYQNAVCSRCEKKISEGLEYTLIDNTYYKVSGIGECTDTDIVIPETYNNLPVKSIGDSAFEKCTSLTSVEIGNSVTSIGNEAFYKCTSLTSVEIGDRVKSIGSSAFQECTSLTSVEIGDRVTSIGDYAFSDCWNLKSIVIPNSVTSIGKEAFFNCFNVTSVEIGKSVASIDLMAFGACSSLTSIMVDKDNRYYQSIEGNLYNINTSTGHMLVQYAIGKTATFFSFPDRVANIGGYAFWACTNLTSVEIGNDVTGIGDSAFAYCDNLTSVEIGNSVTTIWGSAFRNCDSLTSIEIPNSVRSIGERAFSDCSSLTSVVIGNSVTSIDSYAFSDCTSLTSVVIGDSVISIDGCVFKECTSLTSVTFKNPNGWTAGTTSLSATDLSNTATAATYLKNTYYYNTWIRK